MKQWMLRLAAAFSMALVVSLTATQAQAQGTKPPAGAPAQPSAADQKAMQDFQKKAGDIQKKYMPQIQAVQKKYKPQMDVIEKKYKPKMDALKKEGDGIKPEDRQGPKGQAILKKLVDLQKQMMAEPDAKKMLGEIKPIAKKMGDEILAAAPAKLKPQIKQTVDAQMKVFGG